MWFGVKPPSSVKHDYNGWWRAWSKKLLLGEVIVLLVGNSQGGEDEAGFLSQGSLSQLMLIYVENLTVTILVVVVGNLTARFWVGQNRWRRSSLMIICFAVHNWGVSSEGRKEEIIITTVMMEWSNEDNHYYYKKLTFHAPLLFGHGPTHKTKQYM